MSDDILDQWHRGIRTLHIAHAKAAARFHRRGRILGVPVMVLTSVLGTGLFASLGDADVPEYLKIVGGLIAAAAAVLSAVQTFLNYPMLAEKHDQATLSFGALRRGLESAMDAAPPGESERAELLADVAERWSAIERESPIVPNDLYRAAATRARTGTGGPRSDAPLGGDAGSAGGPLSR